jgi:hypothetical protein
MDGMDDLDVAAEVATSIRLTWMGKYAGELAAAGDVELAVDGGKVVLGGLDGDEQPGCDLGVGQPVGGR